MYAGFAVGALTIVLVILRILPLASMLGAVLFIVLGAGARQFSIAASILALLLYGTSVITSIVHGMIGSGIVIAVIVSSLFISAIRAALFMRRHPEGLETTKWNRFWRWARPVVFTVCGITILLAVVSLFIPANAVMQP